MAKFGYTLMTEEHGPRALVENAGKAEDAGFDFAVMSDHFHPWLDVQGQAPFAWSVWGAVAERTERMGLMSMVTCPLFRYHPAVVAQAAATVALLSDGRFTLGVGAGENLNEHVVGQGWPSATVRHEMLEEAIHIMRLLWHGGFQHYEGKHLRLDDARLYSLPATPPPLAIAAGGPQAARLAADRGDGIIITEPRPDLVEAYRDAGGEGPVYGQVAVCVADDEERALQIATERWRFAAPGWKVQAELPAPVNFDAATKFVRPDDLRSMVGIGPDPDVHLQAIRPMLDAGVDHLALVQIGPDQDAFLRLWQSELRSRLEEAAASAWSGDGRAQPWNGW